MDSKPTHMLDMLKCSRTTSRSTWLAVTKGGEHTLVPCERGEDTPDGAIVRIVRDEQEYVFAAPVDALSPIPTTPTLVPPQRKPQPVEHAPLPVKTPRALVGEREDPPTKRHRTEPPAQPQDAPRKRRGDKDAPSKG